MKTIASIFGLVALLPPAWAQGGWKQLDGQPAPKIAASDWLNADGQRVDSKMLSGKVWLLEFFATT